MRQLVSSKTLFPCLALLFALGFPFAAHACETVDRAELLERVTTNFFTTVRGEADFYAIYIPVQRVIQVNGERKSFSAIQVLELSAENIPLRPEQVLLAEIVDNDTRETNQTEVNVLVHEMGSVTLVSADTCGNIQNIVR